MSIKQLLSPSAGRLAALGNPERSRRHSQRCDREALKDPELEADGRKGKSIFGTFRRMKSHKGISSYPAAVT